MNETIGFLQLGLSPTWEDVPSAVLTAPEYDTDNATHTGAAYRHDGSIVLESLRTARPGHWRHVDPLTVRVADYADAPVTNVAIYGGHFFNMWGHFLFETMTTAAMADQLPPGWPVVFTPFAPGDPEQFRAVWDSFATFLSAGGWGDRELILQTEAMRFNILIVPQRLSVFGLPNGVRAILPEVADVFTRIGERFANPNGRKVPMVACRPVWAARQHPSELEVYAQLAAHGFQLLDVVHMTPGEQAAAFSSATALIGFAGSNMHNSVLCPAGIPVIEIADARSYLSPDRINPVQTSLCSLMSQKPILVDSYDISDDVHVPFTSERIVELIMEQIPS